jgi:hypothetical protein
MILVSRELSDGALQPPKTGQDPYPVQRRELLSAAMIAAAPGRRKRETTASADP